MSRNSLWGFLLFLALFSAVPPACAAENGAVIIRKGKPVASGIYISAECEKNSPVRLAAKDLSTAVERMSGAKISIVEVKDTVAVPNKPAVVLGSPAAELGAAPESSSLWKDISRTVIGNERILIAGESDLAVNGAVMDLLHEQGVRYFLPSNIPGDIGTVMPSKKTVAWSARDEEKHPHIRGRRVWGHNVGAHDWAHAHSSRKWVRRNMGVSPVKIPSSHAWGRLIPKKRRKPEYYAVKRYDGDGNPVRGGQFCVSHPDVPGEVARTIIERFRAEPQRLAQSISPNDGGGACVCLRCKALDPRGHLEPSSGKRALSDRYIYFFNKIADIVAQKYPNRYLAYLVYSDYSRAPVKYTKIHPMIVPVFAPIRYCRLHSMFNPLCEENIRLRHEIEKYARYARHIGYYGYNYNLAETIVPFSKITTWSRNLPWLYKQGLFQATIETLGNWNTNGPHIYLATRYLWSGKDPEAIMNDYYEKLGGAAAEPLRQYWETVDEAYRTADVHSGGFYGPEQVLTKPVLEKMENHLKAAANAAQTEREKRVVDFFQSGLDQGRLALEMISHLNSFEFTQAKKARDGLKALNAKLEKQHIVSIYPNRYTSWFMDKVVDHAAAILERGGKIAVKFPRIWHFRLDYYKVGIEEEWFSPSHGNSHWLTAKTWGVPSLYSQGFGDFKGYQWFKTAVKVPEENCDRMVLWCGSNDGRTRVWINGQPVPFAHKDKKGNITRTWEYPRGWRAFSVPVGHYLKPGKQNTVVFRIDHTLNDLNLGGILRPVMLYVPGEQEWKTLEETYAAIR